MSKIHSKTISYGLLKQANFATPQGASANYKIQNFERGISIPEPDAFIDDANESGQYGIHHEAEQFVSDKATGLPSMAVQGRMVKGLLASWLDMAGLAITENTLTPFDKTITARGLTGTIDYANNAAAVYSLFVNNGISGKGQILENCIFDQLSLKWDFNGRGAKKHAQFSGTIKGNNIQFNQTFSGTPIAKPTSGYFNDTDTFAPSIFTINSVDYSAEIFHNLEFMIDNKMSVNSRTAGKANNYDLIPEYTVKLTMDLNSTTAAILNGMSQGHIVALTFKNNITPDTDGEFGLVIPRGYLTANPQTYAGDYLGISLSIRCYSVAGATPFTINFTDLIDGAY